MAPTRRDFLGATALATAGLALPASARAGGWTRAADGTARLARPAVVASGNGLRGVARALELMNQGQDPLDAAIAGVNIQELDPDDTSVGLGGLPNAEGVVQLDASCMHGPTRRAGAVAALEGIATPSLVAKAVMDYTDHILLVGSDARRFARSLGFAEQELLTDRSRQAWLRWRARLNAHDAWLDYDGDIEIPHPTGTINMCAVNAAGDIGSVTTTSGLAWKLPGRVGDSPIIGAGQYCDNEVGAAGSTGRGEANIKACGAFLTVEFMRQGMAPEAAAVRTLERVVAMTERRLVDDRGRPFFDLQFYAINKAGEWGAAAMYSEARFAVADAGGARLADCAFLFPRAERPQGAAPGTSLPRR